MARVSGHSLSNATNGDVSSSSGEGLEEDEDMPTNVRPAQGRSRPHSSDGHSGEVVAISGSVGQKLVAHRLKQARIAAGYASPKDFAAASDVNATTYYHHENGRRAIRADVAKRYAKLLRLPAGTLLYGEGLQNATTIPIVGRIFRDGRITMAAEGEAVRHITLPKLADLVAYIVVGTDLYPAYRDGDVVFHHPKILMQSQDKLREIHGLECVVEMTDGTILLRTVVMQGDGRATLSSHAAPPMPAQTLRSAAPVEIVRRALPAGFHSEVEPDDPPNRGLSHLP